ncbi:MAG: phospholipase [Bacteroidetes bacterium]|nr:phospholipase [Bacteroidota bacterium]
MAKEQKLSAPKTFRYWISGDIKKADKLLVVLHGYGQLAEFFIRKFNGIPKDYLIVAPEGMHRFYLNGTSGRVGASWMTKEGRESDIADNLNWLTQLFFELTKQKSFKKTILLGFSQGGATAARWFYSKKVSFDQLILWASVFPPDLEKPEIKSNSNNYFVIGTEDEFYNLEAQKNEIEFYEKIGFQTLHFEGKHDIEIRTLNRILKEK